MDVRSQISILFHLDKCIGCHTCSIACKNLWTDRKGAEYMWWNNVETKPGTGFPHRWENQDDYKGGWVKEGNSIDLKGAGKFRGLKNIFHNPNLPIIDDYYEPWTYKYEDLFNAPEGNDQPVAQPISQITGKPVEIKSGPNWDDDLGGSPLYARKDPNLEKLNAQEQEDLFKVEKLVMMYLPRICNHCLNPSCVASCPSGAIYKRGEDGIVLINQEKCRGWRMCVTGCPYKKVFYNWSTGKSEKCLLCYPRIEAGEIPACMHSCVGRIRYLGVLLYDADKIKDVVHLDEDQLVEAQRDMILDPRDPKVLYEARKNGIHDSVIESAQKSPVYRFVKEWKMGLPLHPEYRTLPMLFYVPPLLPILGKMNLDVYDTSCTDYFSTIEKARLSVKYLASLFTAGNEGMVREVLKKMMAVRIYRRSETVGDIQGADMALKEAGLTRTEAEGIYTLTALATLEDRFVIPPSHREEALAMEGMELVKPGDLGFGFRERPERM